MTDQGRLGRRRPRRARITAASRGSLLRWAGEASAVRSVAGRRYRGRLAFSPSFFRGRLFRGTERFSRGRGHRLRAQESSRVALSGRPGRKRDASEVCRRMVESRTSQTGGFYDRVVQARRSPRHHRKSWPKSWGTQASLENAGAAVRWLEVAEEWTRR